jgi:hypothetical protein
MRVKAKARLLNDPDLTNGTWKAVVMVRGQKEGEDEPLLVEVLTSGPLALALRSLDLAEKGPRKGDLVEMEGELQAKTLRTRGGEKRTRPVLLLESLALVVGGPTAAVGSSG